MLNEIRREIRMPFRQIILFHLTLCQRHYKFISNVSAHADKTNRLHDFFYLSFYIERTA